MLPTTPEDEARNLLEEAEREIETIKQAMAAARAAHEPADPPPLPEEAAAPRPAEDRASLAARLASLRAS